jgi:hypothetical protein
LRQIAEVKDLPSEEVAILLKTSEGQEFLNSWKERQTKRWLKVRSKFRSSQANCNLLYNKMLVATLQDAYRKQDQAVDSANTRWAQKEEPKKPIRQSKPHKTKQLPPSQPIELDDALPLDSKLPSNNRLNADANAAAMPQQCDITLMSFVNNDRIDKVKNDSVSFEQLREAITKPKVSLLKRKAESMFDESLFVITEEMSVHLSHKHSDFVSGDWDYMVEEFKNVFYGKKKASWKRTFYTFVNNQTMRYGYQAGDYLKRQTQPNTQRLNSQQPTRQQQAERNLNELSARYLQESGTRNTEDTEEALPLTADDIRNSS